MIRRNILAAMAVAIGMLATHTVMAGGPVPVPVRMKNVGSLAVSVNAASGSVPLSSLVSGARQIASNGITQFSVKPGAFSALAANPSSPLVVNKVRSFNTRTFKTIYLYASQDGTTATLVGAPGGVKF
jgi:hypothetical protein